jgi:hypothetical protein
VHFYDICIEENNGKGKMRGYDDFVEPKMIIERVAKKSKLGSRKKAV